MLNLHKLITCSNGLGDEDNCTSHWQPKQYLYGNCLQFFGFKTDPLKFDSKCHFKSCKKYTPPESTNQKLDANEMRLEFVVAFNDSDSTAGWFQFFLGTTLYLSSQGCMDYHSGPNYQPLTINGLSIWHHHAPLSKHS